VLVPFIDFFRPVVLGIVLFSALSCTAPRPADPVTVQWAADSATVRVAAGAHYARGSVWRFFWGTHYRNLWATPVTVPVLRLATAQPGGLQPLQAGGSYQSRTLRLQASNGRQYVLRSVDKDASGSVPAGWRRWLLGGLMKDQTSVIQPYGAYVAAELADAAGVYHANPRLVYLSDDPALGEFRARYANALYLLEERPDGDQRAVASFGHSPQVVSSAKMLADIRRHPASRVAARTYLRARLLDMWLGDWSRREDQWRWASFPRPGGHEYRPIPRDRDQAFFLLDDGALTKVASWLVPKFQSFHGHLRPGRVEHLTRTARALDRTLLAGLSEDDFAQVADSLRLRLTDATIAQALLAGPPEIRAPVSAHFAPLLKARREELPAAARRYQQVLMEDAWVIGTDQPERFVLSPAGQGRVLVQVLLKKPAGPDSLLSEQAFDVRHTRRLHLFGLGGDDVFELRGPLKPGFAIGFHGGNGTDQVVGAATKGSSGLTWYTSSSATPAAVPTDVRVRPDPERAINYNAAGWLERYNLND
jgi:hypothetical protein